MNIIETSIPDVTKHNINKHKEVIADNIIQNVYPLFDEVYQAKLEQVAQLKNKIKSGKREMGTQKETMQQLLRGYRKEKKVSKLLERIEKLVQSGLTYDGTMKHEMVILLKIVDKLPEDKLDFQMSKTIQILNKRFSQ
jgi:predicted Holliday junction resolvase-like endonuclease